MKKSNEELVSRVAVPIFLAITAFFSASVSVSPLSRARSRYMCIARSTTRTVGAASEDVKVIGSAPMHNKE